MILRRIKAHVEKENWFAVGIDFAIVVIGVFIGLQVANWNASRQDGLSEAQYLKRFAEEISTTITHIEVERAFANDSLQKIETFTEQLYGEDTPDAHLVAVTRDYLTDGAFFANFRPSRTTFDDLVSTGNIDIIGNRDLRAGLVNLHVSYDGADNAMESNITWLQQGEERIYYDFDAFRYDARTQGLFDEVSDEALARDIRSNREMLRRHAAFHYWLKTRSVEIYDDIQDQAETVLETLRSEQGATP